MDVAVSTGGWASQVIAIIDDLCKRFGIAIDWSQENIMPILKDLAQKLVNFEIATSILWGVFGLALIIVAICTLKRGVKIYREKDGFDDLAFGLFVIGAICIISGIVIVPEQIIDILKCKTFPELYVYEHITSLIQHSH